MRSSANVDSLTAADATKLHLDRSDMDLLYPNRQWPMDGHYAEDHVIINTPTTNSSGSEQTAKQLCDDLWLKILEYLKLRDLVPMRLVCSGWNELITVRLLTPRKEITICLAPYSTSKFFRREAIADSYYVRHYRQLLRPLEANHAGLQQLKVLNFLVGQWWLTTEFSWRCQDHKQQHQQKLKSATFIDCTFMVTLASLADHLRTVTRLELINCDLLDADIRTIGETIGDGGQLEHLNVSFNGQLTGTHLHALGPPLRSLNLGHCHRLDDFKLCYGLQALLYKGVRLEVLNLKPLNPNGSLHLTAAFVVGELDRLQELKLNPNYHLFAVEQQRQRSSSTLVQLPTSASPAPALAATVRKLTLLGRCELPTSENHNNIQNNNTQGQQQTVLPADRYLRWFFAGGNSAFEHLQYLSLTDWSPKWTSDEGLAAVFAACSNLLYLKLVGLPFATARSMDVIPLLMTRLRTVKFVDVNLTDRLVVTLLDRCPALRTLVIDFPDGGQAKPYHLSEAVIHEAVSLCSRSPSRRLTVRISKSLLPTHKLFTIPGNLSLEILRSRAFHGRAAAIYVDEPVVG